MFTNDIYVKKRREWMQRVLMLNEKIKNLDAQVNIFYFIIHKFTKMSILTNLFQAACNNGIWITFSS